jgi:hypothetical protein
MCRVEKPKANNKLCEDLAESEKQESYSDHTGVIMDQERDREKEGEIQNVRADRIRP